MMTYQARNPPQRGIYQLHHAHQPEMETRVKGGIVAREVNGQRVDITLAADDPEMIRTGGKYTLCLFVISIF